MTKMKTQEMFEDEANATHHEIFDYSKAVYKGNKYKVLIICPNGHEFWQFPGHHINGCGCSECKNLKRRTTKEYIVYAQSIHGTEKYNYSEVYYKNNYTKIKIFCNDCQEYFWQFPQDHTGIKKCGCQKCAIEKNKDVNRTTQDEFIQESKNKHGSDAFDYSNVHYINTDTPVNLICNVCKYEFSQRPHDHLSKYKLCGCPKCKSSTGEKSIFNILKELDIKNKPQYKNSKCKLKAVLRFDFAILDEFEKVLCLIEYQGIQHYFPTTFGGISMDRAILNLEETKLSDYTKKKWCIDSDLELLEIKYTDKLVMKDIIIEFLEGLKK